jgi:hypothetical protein
MAVVSLKSRLEALERKTAAHAGPVAVALMAEGADPAPIRADAIRSWENGHGRPFPKNGCVLDVVLVGVKPGEAVGHA